jgi:hypothetical protein
MKIFHGDNQVASRKSYIDHKNRSQKAGFEIRIFEGLEVTASELSMALATTSLLAENQAVYIENFFSRRPGKEKEQITLFLLEHLDSNINIWESKNVSILLKKFPSDRIERYDPPKSLFGFLETLNITHLHLALSTTPPEQLLVVLANHVHNLILVKTGVNSFPAWQYSKLTNQAKMCDLKNLIDMQQNLTSLDYRQKTSNTPLKLEDALELWVLSL